MREDQVFFCKKIDYPFQSTPLEEEEEEEEEMRCVRVPLRRLPTGRYLADTEPILGRYLADTWPILGRY